MRDLKWTHRTTQKIADALADGGIEVSHNTVARLLKSLGFSLRVNHKKVSSGSPSDRDEQFTYINSLREHFEGSGDPVVSVDTKKKELVGNFKNQGAAWCDEARRVKDHDFRSEADGIAIPYGVYDIQANRGSVFVGTSHDTADFAVDNLVRWWRFDGHRRYPSVKRLLILADGGGSNSPRSRAWKHGIQERLSDRFGLTVTVCHYPTGASKWNPIEHRLFSEISKNWAARPLDSYDTISKYLSSTTTRTGLRVKPYIIRRNYENGRRIPDEQMAELNLTEHETQPSRNYTLGPRLQSTNP
jgi:hypothetical protein